MSIYQKPIRLKSKKLTDSAKDKDCTVRIFGVCNYNTETTVAAHLGGAGMGTKASDIHIAYCCSDCHSWLDGGYSNCLLYTSPSPRDGLLSRMPSSA